MRSLIGASLAVVLVLPVAASVPEAPAEDARSFLPAACNQFGLTPRAAERERRATERRELRQRDAIRIARELRTRAARALNPQTPGAALPATRVSAAELVRLSAGTGRVVTAEVIEANEQLNERRYSFYDPEGRLIAETEWSTAARPAIEWEYVWFGDMPLAQIDVRTGSIAYYFTDHLETPMLQADEQGRVIWRAEQDPYGGIFAIRSGEDRHQPLRFPGQVAESGGPEADLHHNVFRWYRSEWGRYTQADPIGLEGDPHPYGYALSNPIAFSDPLGLKVRICCRPSFARRDHCYIEEQRSGRRRTWALHNENEDGGYLNQPNPSSSHRRDYPTDRGGICETWREDCDGNVGKCLQNAFEDYPVESYSEVSAIIGIGSGRNSNTFVKCIARKCGLSAGRRVTERAPGYHQPCPAGF